MHVPPEMIALGLLLLMVALVIAGQYRGGEIAMTTVTAVKMPPDAFAYKRLPGEGYFTKDTILKGLLSRHNTKAGVWGQINVVKGKLQLQTLDGELETVVMSRGQNGVVAPRQYHQVKPLSDDLQMFIVFHQIEDEGPRGGGFG
eukprot:TRINITY_DN18058_c0_g1_i2.p1 TRINITY_DN18058_c0_g1~~TRINITY_DN18058_c0_g1_i2.p1  ORF type:complete len:144 (+),score=37.68 TRINITY_DN18058_c0_g1_i2:195-626(+)